MTYRRRNPTRWIVLAVFAGLATGLIWAFVETGKSPLELFGRKPERKPRPRKTARKREKPPKPAPIIKSEPEKRVEKPKPEPKKPVELPKPEPSAPAISTARCALLKRQIERALLKGRFDEAQDKLDSLDPNRIPPGFESVFADLARRLDFYLRMIAETDEGRLVPPPELYSFELVNGRKISAKLITTTESSYIIETLVGLAAHLQKKRVKGEPRKLSTFTVLAELDQILKRRCRRKGIDMRIAEDGTFEGFFDAPAPGKPPPTAMSYFDMAEFCIQNGLPDYVSILLDEALKRDPNLAKNVHETKARRLLDYIRYLDGIHATQDMAELFQQLNQRYYDTEAYAASRSWLAQKFGEALVRKPEEKPIARVGPDTKNAPPAEDHAGGGSKPEVRPAKNVDLGWERRYDGPVTMEEAKKQIEKGDALFKEGKQHLQNSDPNLNPSWAEENKKALLLFSRAFEHYDNAQIIYERLGRRVPAFLLDKARETNMIRAMCRKRAVVSGD